MALAKSTELRNKAQALLDQAKKLEQEAVGKLGAEAAKFLAGTLSKEQLEAKAIEYGFEVASLPGPKQQPKIENKTDTMTSSEQEY